MAGIRQRNTTPEQVVDSTLRSLGLRYRRSVKRLPGSPDFANRKRGWAIFVHGCFWHHHTGCKYATIPKSNTAFWKDKFEANRRRDASAIRSLRSRGFKVILVWECETKGTGSPLRQILESCRVNR